MINLPFLCVCWLYHAMNVHCIGATDVA